MHHLIAPVAVSAIVLLLGVAYGLQYRFADALYGYFAAASALFLALLALLTVIALRPATAPRQGGNAGLRIAAWLLVSLSWLVNVYLNSRALGPVPWPVAALAPPLAGAALARWRGSAAGGYLFAACALAFGAWVVAVSPIDVKAANMLPLVTAGSADFLAGANPYLGAYPQIAEMLHFHYLPALWLPYAATVAAGVDPRLLNLALLVVIALLWQRAAAREGRLVEFALVLGPLLVSPVVTKMLVHGHVWPYWLVLTLLSVALAQSRLLLAAALLGLALATRQLAVFVAGPLAAGIVAGAGLARASRYAAVTLACFLVLMAPFALWTPDFWQLTFLGLPGKGEAHVLAGNPLDQLGATGLLLQAGLDSGAVRALQALLLLAFTVLAWRAGRAGGAPLLCVLGTAYLWAVSLNPFLYQYHYVPGLLLLAGGLILPAPALAPAAAGARPDGAGGVHATPAASAGRD